MKIISFRERISRSLAALIIGLLLSSASLAVELYTEFPESINPAENYVFYSHGFIVEGDNPRPVSPQYGVYDFPEIKRVLFAMGGFNLIAEQRPAGTEVSVYVNKLVSWVHTLLDAGVPPSHITLLGFSRGAQLTALASSQPLIQRFGSALNLNVHFHMLFLDGVFIDSKHGGNQCFHRAKAPTSDELAKLTHTIAHRVGRYLEHSFSQHYCQKAQR